MKYISLFFLILGINSSLHTMQKNVQEIASPRSSQLSKDIIMTYNSVMRLRKQSNAEASLSPHPPLYGAQETQTEEQIQKEYIDALLQNDAAHIDRMFTKKFINKEMILNGQSLLKIAEDYNNEMALYILVKYYKPDAPRGAGILSCLFCGCSIIYLYLLSLNPRN